jgi:3-oxoacyl-[acyl-carrier-protein] synthase-3
MAAFITAAGSFLPGDPVGNDQIEDHLGRLGPETARIRERMLASNGIESRHYALAEGGRLTMLNEDLAVAAVGAALKERGLAPEQVEMMAVATTQADLLVPGFASMVHGRLGGGPMELLSVGGVCCSGTAALRAVEMAIRGGEHRLGVAAASELVSRALTADRLSAAAGDDGRIPFDALFLRWMLSDGAGAVVVESQPAVDRPSLRIDWSYLRSHAHRYPLCMYAGVASPQTVAPGTTWQDQATPGSADAGGMLNLRQDVRVLANIVALGVEEYVNLVRAGRIDPRRIDHFLCHYSSEHFRGDVVRLMSQAGLMIPEDRWFTNLHSKGNTGSASVYIMLEEAWRTGRFQEGDRILLMVPESGRFTVSFVHLTCLGPDAKGHADGPGPVALPEAAQPQPPAPGPDWLIEELALVWAEFERRLSQVPVVGRIESGQARIEDYRRLLRNLRQQVMEGSRWISRAASSLGVDYAEVRAQFIHHAGEEQRDFRMLERDYVAIGGELSEIQGASKNVGSEALSAFIFSEASKPDPLQLLGAMFIIEGLGARKAARWAQLLVDHLELREDQVSFLRYHGEADEGHTNLMIDLLRSDLITPAIGASIVRTAKVVARLYALQLEELDNV